MFAEAISRSISSRGPVCRLVILMVLAFAGMCLAANDEPGDRPAAAAANNRGPGGPRLREGTTLVDVPGYFRLVGDRATFYTADGKERFGGLENLNLERIAVAIDETPDQLEWSISGTITEYHGSNHLLITRAILKTKPAAGDRPGRRKQPTEPLRSESTALPGLESASPIPGKNRARLD